MPHDGKGCVDDGQVKVKLIERETYWVDGQGGRRTFLKRE